MRNSRPGRSGPSSSTKLRAADVARVAAAHLAQPGQRRGQRPQARATLDPAAHDRRHRGSLAGQEPGRHAGARAGPQGGDERAVHDGDRQAGRRVGQHDEAAHGRQPQRRVAGEGADPLHAQRAGGRHEGRHGMGKGAAAGIDADLGRQLDLAAALAAKALLDRRQHVGHRQAQPGDVVAAQVQKRRAIGDRHRAIGATRARAHASNRVVPLRAFLKAAAPTSSKAQKTTLRRRLRRCPARYARTCPTMMLAQA